MLDRKQSVSKTDTGGHWLSARRVSLYGRALLFAQASVALAFLVAEIVLGSTANQSFIGNDFRVFWSASQLGLQGHGADAYDIARLFPVQQSVAPYLIAAKPWQYWFYPPTFLLAVLPLSLVPYFSSYALFTAAGLSFYLHVLRSITRHRGALVLALGFPAVLFAALNGQNALITAALAGLSLLLLERRPILSGMLLGTLIIKPHLAVLFVVALLCGRRWRAFLSAAGTSLALLLVSILVFGKRSGLEFLNNLHLAQSFAEHGLLPLQKMPTMFAGARLLGIDVPIATCLHYLVALLAGAIVAYVWSRNAAPYLRNSALIIGCLLVSPHLFDYDLVWLAWPVAWMSIHAIENGWRKGERELLLLTWASPSLGETLACAAIQIEPFLLLAFLCFILQRMRSGQPQ